MLAPFSLRNPKEAPSVNARRQPNVGAAPGDMRASILVNSEQIQDAVFSDIGASDGL